MLNFLFLFLISLFVLSFHLLFSIVVILCNKGNKYLFPLYNFIIILSKDESYANQPSSTKPPTQCAFLSYFIKTSNRVSIFIHIICLFISNLTFRYTLTVRQQPEKARLCSFKDKGQFVCYILITYLIPTTI
jgi:hypothetical protein